MFFIFDRMGYRNRENEDFLWNIEYKGKIRVILLGYYF